MKKGIPIFIGVLIVAYLSLYAIIPLNLITASEPWQAKVFIVAFAAIAIALIVAVIATVRERLKEIDKEDKDDLSKY